MSVPDDELVDIIELIPVLVPCVHVSEQGLKLWSSRDAHVEALGCDERIRLKQVEVVPASYKATTVRYHCKA